MQNEKIRLQKYLSEQGICSRRQAEQLIIDGSIFVNNKKAILGIKINPDVDKIEIKNEKFGTEKIENKKTKLFYIILNKPTGYITSTTNKQGKSVLDLLIPENYFGKSTLPKLPRLYPVGRLDKDSDGLILLTNDGALTNELTHPSYEHKKEYSVILSKNLKEEDVEKLSQDITLRGTHMSGMNFLNIQNNTISVMLTEGKNRQIRKMFGHFGYGVLRLTRVCINKLKLGNLPSGHWTKIGKDDIM